MIDLSPSTGLVTQSPLRGSRRRVVVLNFLLNVYIQRCLPWPFIEQQRVSSYLPLGEVPKIGLTFQHIPYKKISVFRRFLFPIGHR